MWRGRNQPYLVVLCAMADGGKREECQEGDDAEVHVSTIPR